MSVQNAITVYIDTHIQYESYMYVHDMYHTYMKLCYIHDMYTTGVTGVVVIVHVYVIVLS